MWYCAHIQRTEGNTRHYSSGSVYFEKGLSLAWNSPATLAAQRACRNWPVSAFLVLGLQVHITMPGLLVQLMEIKHGSLSLQSKCFTGQAISQPVNFAFVYCACGIVFRVYIRNPQWRSTPGRGSFIFSSNCFTILVSWAKSLIHLELILPGVR